MLLVVKWISVDGQEVSASDFWNRPGMHPDFRSCCDVSIVRSTTDRRWVQFEWHQLAFVSSVFVISRIVIFVEGIPSR